MVWIVHFNATAAKTLQKLDKTAQKRIMKYLQEHVVGQADVRLVGKPLRGEPSGRWRYRAGDYRIICAMDEAKKTVKVLHVGHRREIYQHL